MKTFNDIGIDNKIRVLLPDPRNNSLPVFFIIQSIAHISAFIKGLTPYPKWCWIFCLPVGMGITAVLNVFGNYAFINAITAGWISVGNIWMFLGLLIMKKNVGPA